MEGHFKLTYSLFKGTSGVILQVKYLEKTHWKLLIFRNKKNISIVHGFMVQKVLFVIFKLGLLENASKLTNEKTYAEERQR